MAEKKFYLQIDDCFVGVTEEVYREYKRAEDKEQYFMKRLKKGRFVISEEDKAVSYIPSREVSLEQLLERDWNFPDKGEAVDDKAVRICLLEKLEEALYSLSSEELALVMELFYLEKSERGASATLHMARSTLRRRKTRILKKLKKKMEKS